MKTPEILAHLRSRIVQGEFRPGDKLPNRPELLRQYSVSVGAFQKCINQLIDWNFLESRGMKGMCVTQNPPHLSRFAIILPKLNDTFLSVFQQAAVEYRSPDITFCYYQVGALEATNHEVWEQFAAHAENGLLAGVITVFMPPPQDIQERLGDFPCVVISRSRHDQPHAYPEIMFDIGGLFQRQFELLIKRGCKNIAVLAHGNTGMTRIMEIIKIAQASSVNCPRRWIHGIHLENTRNIFYDNLLDLLFDPSQTVVPDGLAVLNENFLPLVTNALARHNLTPGKDVCIACHCNIPASMEKVAENDYVGFDNHQTLEQALRILLDWRNGRLIERQISVLIPPCSVDTMRGVLIR